MRSRLLGILTCALGAWLTLVPAAFAQRGTVQVIDNGALVTGIAVNNSTGNLYALSAEGVKVYDPSGAFQFQFGTGGLDIAIDKSTGEVYVLEAQNNRVAKYDAEGKLAFYFGWNVDQTQPENGPDICPRSGFPADVCQAGERSTELGALGAPEFGEASVPARGIAVGPTGSVYVSEPGRANTTSGDQKEHPHIGNRRVQVFSRSGEFVSSFSVADEPVGCNPQVNANGFECVDNDEPYKVSVDSQGTVYTTPDFGIPNEVGTAGQACGIIGPRGQRPPCVVKRFTASGKPLDNFASSLVPAGPGHQFRVAVDQSDDQVYIYQVTGPNSSQYEVAVYDSNGNPLEQVGVNLPGPFLGAFQEGLVTVRDGTSRAYASDGSTRIFSLDNLASLPAATVDPIAVKTSDTATFTGTANPNTLSFKAGYHFEYRAEGETSWTPVSVSDVEIGSGTTAVPATQNATGLDPNTTYHVRLVVSREVGAGFAISQETTFTTAPEPPRLSLVQASRVRASTATVQADVDARHSATTYYFEWGATEAYGNVVPLSKAGDAGSALGTKGVFEQLENLDPSTTYHFRVVAKNQAGEVSSPDQSFTTLSQSEATWPARGIELVSSPDKGNQHAVRLEEGRGGMAPDGSKIVWSVTSGAPESTTGALGLFVATRTSNGWVSKNVIPPAEEQVGGGDLNYEFIESSPDLSKFLFTLKEGVFSGSSRHALVRTTVGGAPETLAILPNGQSIEYLASGYTDLGIASEDLSAVAFEAEAGKLTYFHDGNADPVRLSVCGHYSLARRDGERLYVIGSTEGGCQEANVKLYFVNLQTNAYQQVASQAAELLAVSPTGDSVIYLSTGNIHEWSIEGGDSCLTCALEPQASGAIASADLSHVYFTSQKQLTPDAPVGGGIYVWRVTGGISFVSTGGFTVGSPDRYNIARVTPNGRVLVFKGDSPGITADDNGGLVQLYRYDDATRRTECVSCPGEGKVATAGIREMEAQWEISADGRTVAFITEEPLSPRDVNQGPDVYEWHNGEQRLATDGVTEFPRSGNLEIPRIWNVSEDGEDIFFSVAARLTGEEHDGMAQLFDARVGGGFPHREAPAPCVEDSCQGPLVAPPALLQPGSASFFGAGNEQAPTKNEQIRKKTKHVRRRKAKHKRARRNRSTKGKHASAHGVARNQKGSHHA